MSLDLGYIMKVDPVGLADGVKVRYERKIGVKDNSEVFDPCN